MTAGKLAGHACSVTAMALLLATLAGCGSASTTSARHSESTSSTTEVPAPTSSVPTTLAAPPPFSSSVSAVTATELGGSWHSGCPVDPGQLSMLQLTYWGFDGQAHNGTMVVNTAVVTSVVQVFSSLYGQRFPISEMVPLSAFGGDDNAAAAANDTSGFDCRFAVASGPPHWSMHAYGEAIDVNDLQNPYVSGSTVIPPAGAAYVNRSDIRPGMALPGSSVVQAFAAVGWQWGGHWASTPDYQHFSINGQ